MFTRSTIGGLTGFFRLHERALARAFLASCVLIALLVSVGLFVAAIRIPVLDRVERVLGYWDDRWTRRLEYGEQLVKAKKYAEAAEYLATVDQEFPARNRRHKRDGERERLLRALGLSYAELGKKKLSLETYHRLVEFGPRNFENHHLYAQAALKFQETQVAEREIAAVLKIHPTHIPSVRSLLKTNFDKSNYAGVVHAFENYFNAYLVQPVTAVMGQSSASINVPVDGRFHDVELRMPQLLGNTGELVLKPGPFALEIERVAIKHLAMVGVLGVGGAQLWPGTGRWKLQDMAPIGGGRFRVNGPNAALHLDIPPQPQSVAHIDVRLRLFKPVDAELWNMVRRSYRNLLRHESLKALQDRSDAEL